MSSLHRPFFFLCLLAAAARLQAAPELVSVNAGGSSAAPSISGTGRFVVFTSTARLSPEDVNAQVDVYVRDRMTGTTRLVSDSRGGDQPMISANGRYVIYRGLDAFPKIRLVDLESTEPPRTISYPFSNNSIRYGDLATITPDGRFVLFAFRPDGGSFSGDGDDGGFDTRLVVVDATAAPADRNSAAYPVNLNIPVFTLGRSAMTRDGNTFFFETRDGLAAKDTGASTQDIYAMVRGDQSDFVRVSADPSLPMESGLKAKDSVHDPVLSASGLALFYISERPLDTTATGDGVIDNDRGPTIYGAKATANNYQTPILLATPGIRPLALSSQATDDGNYLVFSGSARGVTGHYVMRLADREVRLVAPGTGAPVISADGGTIAFASPKAFSNDDKNHASDVFVLPNPFGNAPTTAPSVALGADNTVVTVDSTLLITEGDTVSLAASAASVDGRFFYTQLEIDGVANARADGGGFINYASYTLPRGRHKVRATTVDFENVPGQSAELTVDVRAPRDDPNRVFLRGFSGLTRQGDAAGGAVSFAATAYVDNTASAALGPLQLVVTEASDDATWELFGNNEDPVARPEFVLAVVDLPSVPATPGAAFPVAFSGVTRTPEVLPGAGFHGIGYTVQVTLREQLAGGNWVTRDESDLFVRTPRLNEETPGPNGGVPTFNDINASGDFQPNVLQSLTVAGPPVIAAGTSAAYVATANFTPDGSKGVTPTWSVQATGVAASISKGGVLTVGGVTRDQTVTVQASFGTGAAAKTKSLAVTIKKVSPIVSVRALSALVNEGGGVGGFRITRTPVTSLPVTVNYAITGLATPGTDYTALSGTAVIPASASRVDVPVVPLNDSAIEGRESVVLTVQPSSDYRLGAAHSAQLQIEDDEAVPGNQPDAIIRRGAAAVGTKVFDFLSDPSSQSLLANTSVGTPVTFDLIFSNPTTASEEFTVSGGGDFNGFTARYFQGSKDVTAAVVGGLLKVSSVPQGGSTALKLRITPTAATPLLGLMQCAVIVHTTSSAAGPVLTDSVEALVRRTK